MATKKQKNERKDMILKWVKFAAFILVILGGLNLLFMGLFELDIIGGIFGGSDSVASRVFYSFFGLGAVTLLTVVLIRAFSKEENKTGEKTSA